jgi:hypothetical protein
MPPEAGAGGSTDDIGSRCAGSAKGQPVQENPVCENHG